MSALFKKDQPEYRVAAEAQLDLEYHMKEVPVVLEQPGDVDWSVSTEGDYYVADGVIEVPIRMYIKETDESELFVERVIMRGKRIVDRRVDEDEEKAKEQTYGINIDKARAESYVRYHRSLSNS